MKTKLYITYLLTFIFVISFSQTEQMEFDYLRIEDGLPHSTINDFTQDSLGYIWMATDDGVAYYDNYSIKVFRHSKDDTNGINHNQVFKLHIDSENKIWLGTKQSLELYNEKSGTFKHFYLLNMPDREKVPIIEIYQKNDSILLLCTDGGGLRYFNTRNYHQDFFLPKKFQKEFGKRISSIIEDKNGEYWIGTLDRGVFLYDPKLSETEHSVGVNLNFLDNTEIRKIIQLNPEEMLIGTYGIGVIKINVDKLKVEKFHSENKDISAALRVFELVKMDNYLFIGSDGEGLIQFDIENNRTKNYKNYGTDTKSISNNVIRSIYIDQEKSLWLGHFQGGISLSRNKNQFKNIKFSPNSKLSLSHTNVTAILRDSKENIWIGTDGGGLNIIKNGVIYNDVYKNLNLIYTGLNPKKVLSIFEDSEQNIWIGTYLDGVFIYNPNTRRLKPLNEAYKGVQLTNSDIRCITQDRSGKIWIGTNGGGINIINLKTNIVKVLLRDKTPPNTSLSLDWIRFIHEDNYGYIWIGTAYGLNIYDPINETFRHYFHSETDSTSISSNFIYSFSEDINNQIWIGTASGLNKFDRKSDQFNVYDVADGLPNNTINSIIDTEDGYLWISTNNGLSKFDIELNEFKNYNYTDGLASNSFINGAYYNYNSKVLYFGSTAGITYFDPKEITDIDYDIPIVLTDFKIFNQSIQTNQIFDNRKILSNNIAYTNSVELFKRDNVITIEFAALSYSYTDKIEYEYRLLGFSDTWTNSSSEHSVTYTNLKPGTYIFQIRVGNIGKSQPIRNLRITILPPFYDTWWFKLSIFIIASLIIIQLIRIRIVNIKRQSDLIKQKYEIEKLASEKERIDLNEKIHKTKMRFRQDEMNYKNSQLISTTMLLTHKNEKMNQVKNKISIFSKGIEDKELKKDLKYLVETINAEFKVEKDWNRFEEHFNDVHKDFLKRLKERHPELSLTYLRLCTYLKLDLSTKEIASLMNISQRGVEKARSRLRKKLLLGPDDNLIRFISEI